MSELKPCPFCGGDADIVRGDDISGHPRWYKAYCKSCQNRTWEHPRKKNTVKAWNTRTNTDDNHNTILDKAIEVLDSCDYHNENDRDVSIKAIEDMKVKI